MDDTLKPPNIFNNRDPPTVDSDEDLYASPMEPTGESSSADPITGSNAMDLGAAEHAQTAFHPHVTDEDATTESDDIFTDAQTNISREAAAQEDMKGPSEHSSNTLLPRFEHSTLPSFSDQKQNDDLVNAIPGLYRVLDIVGEQGSGSGGLVDKVIIAQESLGTYINCLSPGAYASIAKVDFSALDRTIIKPLGVYGSKSEIVKFLQAINVIDATTAVRLEPSGDESLDSAKCLRSGLYLFHPSDPSSQDLGVTYVIYWPEDTTWNDDAISSVLRNRIAFMRYLTKVCDQVIALLSPEHSASLLWKKSDAPIGDSDDELDRMYAFEVEKTTEQEENVTSRPGFKLESKVIAVPRYDESDTLETSDPPPTLTFGETRQAILTGQRLPGRIDHTRRTEQCSEIRLRSILAQEQLRLSDNISEEALVLLLNNGLGNRCPQEHTAWLQQTDEAERIADAFVHDGMEKVRNVWAQEEHMLRLALHSNLVDRAVALYGGLSPARMAPDLDAAKTSGIVDLAQAMKYLDQVKALYPRIETFLERVEFNITSSSYRSKKRCILLLETMLHFGTVDEARGQEVVELVMDGDDVSQALSTNTGVRGWLSGKLKTILGGASLEHMVRAERRASQMPDSQFLLSLPKINERHLFRPITAGAIAAAEEDLHKSIMKKLDALTHQVHRVRNEDVRLQLTREATKIRQERRAEAQKNFLFTSRASLAGEITKLITVIEDLVKRSRWKYTLEVHQDIHYSPSFRYTVYPLELTEMDIQRSQSDPTFVPQPKISSRSSSSFQTTLTDRIMHIQLLQNDQYLLVIGDNDGNCYIYSEKPVSLGQALEHQRSKKTLKHDKLGDDVLLAFDEQKRMLAICTIIRSQPNLHLFVFDETYVSLRGYGTPVNLAVWFQDTTIIAHIAFVPGADEIVFIDGVHRARVFSLITGQFRPATLQLVCAPRAIFCSPDGACLLTLDGEGSTTCLRAFHWSNFGSSDGVVVDISNLATDAFVVTSFVNRNAVYAVALDLGLRQCRSRALGITRRVTEFMFKERSGGICHRGLDGIQENAAHNSVLDVHADVWTRFPVVPAVRRQAIISTSGRRPRRLTFVTEADHDAFQPYFKDLITAFEHSTRKPVEDELADIKVDAMNFSTFMDVRHDNISSFRAGEWIVDLLCLIPIQIAVTRDNRFIPLKDGVWSQEVERSLLGAKVEQIVDTITLGWYESLLQTYMASKPVKVVSSMGEQSVGKSFALNHLVDTSFAGSAMRTTEGVWLSVTPTEDALVVALDFEGVHSIERSAQEDTLLVLFNTAISNLVLFRNNFAFSRDITGLFQSFQSSASILDPSANPSLFQSTLVIIIKDVIESDKADIAKEFRHKFQDIVHLEQGSNFITRLHAGRLNIIPWPVIESRQFYTLFPAIKRLLDKQRTTHHKAGIFLQTIKTLMAKLKANDWGALDQNMAAHRAQLLLTMLPTALTCGASEIYPEFEPLKNLDIDEILASQDSPTVFYLSATGDTGDFRDRADALIRIISSFERYGERLFSADSSWFSELETFLETLLSLRIQHVQHWLSVNTSRLPSSHPDLEALRRLLDNYIVELKGNMQLCGMSCKFCHLLCLNVRHHSDVHDCGTSHRCARSCEYRNEHSDKASCGLPAGHSGAHICAIQQHLCGMPCMLGEKGGCLQRCAKAANHEEEDHICPAQAHECGQACSLYNVLTEDGRRYTCQERCRIPSHQPHDFHRCEKQSCPLECQLCRRLCANTDHHHGLLPHAIHLCGQDHPCPAICQAPGICRIETAPQSVEAVFTGTYEIFQYTKYSQVSKRLPCAVTIRAGEVAHQGPHNHESSVASSFHHCETRCENCGYFCTLPLGHTQQEHDTSHGSMSQTRWVVDGPEGTIFEVDGRRFASNDNGAPMMCNMVCQSQGRHVHVDYCRADSDSACEGDELQHVTTPMSPNPQRAKDLLTHKLYWRRTGFKDPYSQEDKNTFEKCDAYCAGPEHDATENTAAQPSYCTLPMFHAQPSPSDTTLIGRAGHMSNDGHIFACRNPSDLQQNFHVIFVIDKSGSMSSRDIRPLPHSPSTPRIVRTHNNRLGAVYSSLHSFWSARAAPAALGGTASGLHRDVYSLLLFDDSVVSCIENDARSSPDELLATVLAYSSGRNTNVTSALVAAQACMERHWAADRTPVVILLSDGECRIADETMYDLCRRAVAFGKRLSFHAVAFGSHNLTLRRMARIATEVENGAPADPLHRHVASSFTQALDTVRLAETFLGIAESLRKPRGALLHA